MPSADSYFLLTKTLACHVKHYRKCRDVFDLVTDSLQDSVQWTQETRLAVTMD